MSADLLVLVAGGDLLLSTGDRLLLTTVSSAAVIPHPDRTIIIERQP